MTDIDRRLSAADPILGTDLSRFEDHREELIQAIIDSPVTDTVRTHSSKRPKKGSIRIGISAAAVCVLVLVVLIVRGSAGRDEGSAWAAELVAFAESSPRVLIDQPGWEVTYVDELGERQGLMKFDKSGVATSPGQRNGQVELSWNGQPIEDRISALERSHHVIARDVPILGTASEVFEQGNYKRLKPLISAVDFEGRTLTVRTVTSDPDWFVGVLSSLEKVDVDTWLSALPPNAIRAVDRDPVVDEMLRGIPLPDGFSADDIPESELLKDRYQLGVNVAGSITCAWFQQWANARRSGDQSGAEEAVNEMGSSREWPVLLDMDKEGGYPLVIWQFADAMRDGPTFFGRPLLGEVNQGLGCPRLGIDLEKPHTNKQTKETP